MKKVSTMIALFLLAFTVVTQTAQAQTISSSRAVISPYYQSDIAGGVYTFIGVTHPSLAGSVSQIGLRITAVGSTGASTATSTGNNYVEFTINGGNTQRVFIVVTNHSSINTHSITDTTTSFIALTTAANASGIVRALSSNIHPTTLTSNNNQIGFSSTNDANNLAQLSFWGAVVSVSASTGFAMEFIGDAHDSVSRVDPNDTTFNTVAGSAGGSTGSGYGRGIN